MRPIQFMAFQLHDPGAVFRQQDMLKSLLMSLAAFEHYTPSATAVLLRDVIERCRRELKKWCSHLQFRVFDWPAMRSWVSSRLREAGQMVDDADDLEDMDLEVKHTTKLPLKQMAVPDFIASNPMSCSLTGLGFSMAGTAGQPTQQQTQQTPQVQPVGDGPAVQTQRQQQAAAAAAAAAARAAQAAASDPVPGLDGRSRADVTCRYCGKRGNMKIQCGLNPMQAQQLADAVRRGEERDRARAAVRGPDSGGGGASASTSSRRPCRRP